MDYGWVLPSSCYDYRDYNRLWRISLEEAKQVEKSGFSHVLVSSLPEGMDPWAKAGRLLSETSSLRVLIGQNTSLALPTITARSASTLNAFYQGRVDLNIVTGSFGYVSETNFSQHAERYRRTMEFADALKAIFAGKSAYEGEFFSFKNFRLFPPEEHARVPNLFMAGRSDEAVEAATKFGDRYVMFAEPMHRTVVQLQRVRSLNPSLQCGIFINIIARETKEQALQIVRAIMDNTSIIYKKMVKMFTNNCDSEGFKTKLRFMDERDEWLDEHLWIGLSRVSNSVGVSIVGSYEDVIETILKYRGIGVDFFLFSSLQMENPIAEIERIGKYILPALGAAR